MKLYCCACGSKVKARLTDGAEIYPHREDLHKLPFWKCDTCNNHVGCHYKTRQRTKPLGVIPTNKLRKERKHIHQLIDPAWKSGLCTRSEIYAHLSKQIGRKYHTAGIRTVEEARRVFVIASNYIRSKEKEKNH